MDGYNETLEKLILEIERISQIAYTELRNRQYRIKEDYIKFKTEELKGNISYTATQVINNQQEIQYQKESRFILNSIEDLIETKRKAISKVELLFDR